MLKKKVSKTLRFRKISKSRRTVMKFSEVRHPPIFSQDLRAPPFNIITLFLMLALLASLCPTTHQFQEFNCRLTSVSLRLHLFIYAEIHTSQLLVSPPPLIKIGILSIK